MPLFKQPFRDWLFSSAYSVLILCFIALMVELDSGFGLFLFSNQIGKKVAKNGRAFAGTTPCDIEKTVFGGILPVPCSIHPDRHFIEVAKGFYGTGVSHLYGKSKRIRWGFSPVSWGYFFDGNATFAVNKSCEICFVHPDIKDSTKQVFLQESFPDNSSNSVDTLTGRAEGNTEPSSEPEARGRVYRLCGEAVRQDIVGTAWRHAECGRNDHALPYGRVTKLENQDASTAMILFQGNLTTNNRRRLGVIQGFTA